MIVISGGKAAQKNFRDVFTQIERDYQTQLAEINARKEKALQMASEIMQGKR